MLIIPSFKKKFDSRTIDCKTVGFFFLKISKEIGKAWPKSLARAKRASLTHRRACEARENKSQFLRANPGINIRHFTGKALAIHHSREYRE